MSEIVACVLSLPGNTKQHQAFWGVLSHLVNTCAYLFILVVWVLSLPGNTSNIRMAGRLGKNPKKSKTFFFHWQKILMLLMLLVLPRNLWSYFFIFI